MDRRAFVAVALAVALSARGALAEGGATETFRDVGVATRDGATFRGELVEKVPGDHVTIKLASGEVKRFAWADVADVAVQTPSPPAKDKDKDDDARPPQMRLVVDGEEGTVLERRQNASEGWTLSIPPGYQRVETWEASCVAPCTTVVDAASVYRVNGSGISTSRNFNLPQGESTLHLHLVGRPVVVHSAGFLLMVAGGIVGLVGVAGLASSPALTD